MTELSTLIEAKNKIDEAYELLQEIYEEDTMNRHPDIAKMVDHIYRAMVQVGLRVSFLQSRRNK
jgi:hypothetical protein